MDAEITTSSQLVKNIFAMLGNRLVDEAARQYSRCQDDIGYLLINSMPQQKTAQNGLAKMFYIAKDFQKAALVFENAGVPDKAAILYEKADDYSMAAEMYCQVGKNAKAAAMFEKAGNFEQAANLFQQANLLERAAANFERAINNYLAGRTYYSLGKHDKAMELLQKVNPAEGSYLEATIIIGDILADQGFHELAIRKYEAVIENEGFNDETVDLYYALAMLYERVGKIDKAKAVYEKILTTKFGYRDAVERLKGLKDSEVVVEEYVEEAETMEDAPLVDEAPIVEEVPSDDAVLVAREEDPQDDAGVVAVMEGFEFLRDTPLFQELSLQDMKKFWNGMERIEVPSGEAVIVQDKPGEAFFLLLAGKVRVERVEKGRTEILATLDPGAFFGEMSLMDDDAVTSANVVAAEVCEMFRMDRETFQELLDSDDRLALKVYRAFTATLMDRLRQSNRTLSNYKKEQDKQLASLFGGA